MDLFQACAAGDVGRVRQLLSEGANVNSRKTSENKIFQLGDLYDTTPSIDTPLMIAGWHGKLEVMRVLLEAGADVHATKGSGGWTPLLGLFFNGYGLREARPLIEAGAEIRDAILYAPRAERKEIRRLYRWVQRRGLVTFRTE